MTFGLTKHINHAEQPFHPGAASPLSSTDEVTHKINE